VIAQATHAHGLRGHSAATFAMPVPRPAQPVKALEPTVSSDWRKALPVLANGGVTLRALRASDAPSLLALLTTEEVTRFISPPPTTIEGFERFIEWAQKEQAAGSYVCFAVVPQGGDTAVGLFQVRQLEANFRTAEWGFAVGSAYWGTGVFMAAAESVLEFAFETLGIRRLEARACVANGRGNGALRKLGASCEATLRRSFFRHGQDWDQHLWSILDIDWRHSKAVWGPGVVTSRG
jgi:ribosomal-protein-alanine N-acetyltransferase